MEDIAVARRTLRPNALRRIPKAIVQSLLWGTGALVVVLLAAGLWLQPHDSPLQWIQPSTMWMVMYVFFSPWPLVYIFAQYHNQHTLLDHIARRVKSGERIPMPPTGVLSVPILIDDDAGRY